MSTERPGAALTAPATVNTWIGGADVAKSTCAAPGCEAPVNARGWCAMHYARQRRTGKLIPGIQPHGKPAERFWPKVDRSGGLDACWPWTGHSTRGYGTFRVGPARQAMAHRVAYELSVGPIPAGFQLDHLCRNPPCCNPAHLEPVTPQENVIRERAARGECPRGHPYATDSTVWRGVRYCTTCRRDASRAAYRSRPEVRAAQITRQRARRALAVAVTFAETRP